jgi:hypothetical protein
MFCCSPRIGIRRSAYIPLWVVYKTPRCNVGASKKYAWKYLGACRTCFTRCVVSKKNGCKTRIADNGYSIVKICNAADAVFAGNPSGRGDFYVLRRRGLLVWTSQTALHRFLHYKKIIPVALAKEVRKAPGDLAVMREQSANTLTGIIIAFKKLCGYLYF